MSEQLIQNVIETIDNTNKHRIQLAELLECLHDAKHQVKDSAERSRNELRLHFEQLRNSLFHALNERESQLSLQISTIESSALLPLQQCDQLLQEQLSQAANVMAEGKQLLMRSDVEASQQPLLNFKAKADNIGLTSLPEVPTLAEVACISVELPQNLNDQIVKNINDHGRVISKGPVQIGQIDERSGAVLVSWSVVEEDFCADISEYRLQYCSNIIKNNNEDAQAKFTNVYQGSNTSSTVRNLKPSSSYTFRVCGRAEGAQAWSPWSIPCVAMTTLPHYEWQRGVVGWLVGFDGKMVCRDGSAENPVVFSSVDSFICGHCIQFRILEVGTVSDEDGISLCVTNANADTLKMKGALFVTASGSIYIDGQEMTTKLPPLQKNSSLVFDTEQLQSGKVRVTIEVAEKSVTVDWNFDKPVENSNSLSSVQFGLGLGFDDSSKNKGDQDHRLFFACRFASEKWKVCVE